MPRVSESVGSEEDIDNIISDQSGSESEKEEEVARKSSVHSIQFGEEDQIR